MKKHIMILCGCILLLSASSCGGDSGPSSEPVKPTPVSPTTVAVTDVSLSKTGSISLMEGTNVEITATVSPYNATNKNVSWKSSDEAVAIVANGKITAVSPGTATITVSTADGNKTATVEVNVTTDEKARQKKALMALYDATGGAQWKHNDGWGTDADIKDWYGLKVSNGYVTEIKLSDNNLKGEIPEMFGETMPVTRSEAETRGLEIVAALRHLTGLNLSNNMLSGNIPSSLGNLAELITLDVSYNLLEGNIPESFANLVNVKVLSISHNNLAGEIPEAVLQSDLWKSVGDKVDLTQNGDNKLTGAGNQYVAVTGVALDKTSINLTVNETLTLKATLAPKNATDKRLTWKSDNTAVAAVDANGKVTAVATGTATITVTTQDGALTATCAVTVKEAVIAVTGVTLNKTSLSLTVGGSEALTASILPNNATDRGLNWNSDNTAVATVDAKGLVTAVSAGTATITVITADGGKKATCAVTVNNPYVAVTEVALNKTSLELELGKSEPLTATVFPDNATNKNVSWSSSDNAVAMVDEKGNVKTVAAGTATITVTTVDGKKTATCNVSVTDPNTPTSQAGNGTHEGFSVVFKK